MGKPTRAAIPKEELVKIIKRLLDTSDDLDFLTQLEQDDLERILGPYGRGLKEATSPYRTCTQ